MFIRFSGPQILRAPEDDQGSQFDDDFDVDLDQGDQGGGEEGGGDEDDDQDQDDLEGGQEGEGGEQDARSPQEQRTQRKTFAQRVDERAEALVTERMRDVERRFEERLQQATNTRQTQETQAQRDARLAQMEPLERLEYLRQEDRNFLQSQLQAMRLESQDSADKTAYEALASREPLAAKFKDKVEEYLAGMRRQGITAPRETIYTQLVGEQARKNAGRATARARKTADSNRERQTARAPNGRGDTAPSDRRGDTAAARAKRLEGQMI